MTGARERRWLVVAEDGRHSTLGRHSDPTEQEIAEAGRHCESAGLAAWLVVSEGVYYSSRRVDLMMVRLITGKAADWPAAERLWHARRSAAIEGLE